MDEIGTVSLSEETKMSVEKTTGISYEEFLLIDADEQTKRIEKKIGKRLVFKPIKDKKIEDILKKSKKFTKLNERLPITNCFIV